jgi:hypothetical protein
MKWFHHECSARNDPKLQILGSTHGAEGLGIFWSLLEEIGQHSDTFHLKIMGISHEADESFMNLIQNLETPGSHLFDAKVGLARVPRLPAKILAKNLFTSTKKLAAVIQASVDAGLFDPEKWSKFNVLYSPSFEQRADDYTRRVQRNARSVRTGSGLSPEPVRTASGLSPHQSRTHAGDSPNPHQTISDNVLPETEAEQIQKENRERIEKDLSVEDAEDKIKLSTTSQLENLKSETYLINLTEAAFRKYCDRFRSELSDWNEARSNKFDWIPADLELRKLFFGGEQVHKEALCYSAYNLLGEKTHYAELVLRALRLMLKASEKTRITNPFAWMWTCLHGNGDGTLPWVQLLTADEESSVASLLRRRVRDNHPP